MLVIARPILVCAIPLHALESQFRVRWLLQKPLTNEQAAHQPFTRPQAAGSFRVTRWCISSQLNKKIR